MLARARARAGLFDSHALFSDILDRPAAYLNGTAPLNTTGAVDACVYALGGDASTARCTVATGSARDSFVWCVRPRLPPRRLHLKFADYAWDAAGVRSVSPSCARACAGRYDELHPSEQSDRIVAHEIANTLTDKGSRWTTWFS